METKYNAFVSLISIGGSNSYLEDLEKYKNYQLIKINNFGSINVDDVYSKLITPKVHDWFG